MGYATNSVRNLSNFDCDIAEVAFENECSTVLDAFS